MSASTDSTSSVAARSPVSTGAGARSAAIRTTRGDGDQRRRVGGGLGGEQLRVRSPGGQTDDLEPVRVGGDDVERLGADRTGRTQDDDPPTARSTARAPVRGVAGTGACVHFDRRPGIVTASSSSIDSAAVIDSRAPRMERVAGPLRPGRRHTGVMATRNTLSTRWVTVIMVAALVCSVVGGVGADPDHRAEPGLVVDAPASESPASRHRRRRPTAPSDPTTHGRGRSRQLTADRPVPGPGPGATSSTAVTPAPIAARVRAPATRRLDRYRRDDDHRARPLRGDRRNVVVHPDAPNWRCRARWSAPVRSTTRTRCR